MQRNSDADARIGELERQLASYRKQYNALWDAARRVVERMEKDDNNVTPDTAAALRELAHCVSSNSVAHEPALVEDTQAVSRSWLDILCPRCGGVLNSVSPGISVVAGGKRICTSCLLPDETEIARAKSLT
jgi:hypothetical protein